MEESTRSYVKSKPYYCSLIENLYWKHCEIVHIAIEVGVKLQWSKPCIKRSV